MRRTVTTLLAASVLLVAAACGDDDDGGGTESGSSETPSSEGGAGAPVTQASTGEEEEGMLPQNAQDINPQSRDALQQGGEFRYPISSIPENWNGFHSLGNDISFTSVRSPMEFRAWLISPEGEFQLDTDFVSDYKVVEKPKFTVTYTMNPEAKYNNGEPIDVDDFVATWKANNGENKKFDTVSTDGYRQIESIEAGKNDQEVVITFRKPYPDWQGLFGGMPLAESVATPEAFNDGWAEINPDYFTGPFIFDSFNKAEQVVTLVPNPNWWGEKPLLDKLIYRAVPLDAEAQSFANGELDFTEIGPDPNAYQIASGVDSADLRSAASPDFRHATFNVTAGAMKDKTVRHAVAMGLDRATIGQSDIGDIPWKTEPLNNHFFSVGQEGYQDNAGDFNYDPDGARQLLEDAGWVEGDDGIYEKDGERLTIEWSQISGVPVSENEAKVGQAMLAEVGIEVKVVNVTQQNWGNKLFDGEFEVLPFSYVGSPFPLAGLDQVYATDSSSNYSKSSTPAFDEMVEPIATELDPQKRIDMGNEADAILWDEMSVLPLYPRPQIYAVSDGLANFGAFGLIRFDFAAQWEDIDWMK